MGRMDGEDAFAMTVYDGRQPILVAADTDAGRAEGRAAAQAAGQRVVGAGSLEETRVRMDEVAGLAAAWVKLPEQWDAPVLRLLDRVEQAARQEHFGSLLVVPFAAIDAAAGRLQHPRIHYLCEPRPEDYAIAWADAVGESETRLHDVKDSRSPGLQELSQEVGRIASILATLSDAERQQETRPAAGPQPIDAATIRAMIRLRRLRDQFFPDGLFADPAWDMLLDLMAARVEQRRVAVSSLCIAAAVPPTTALRWIKTMSDHGLFVRCADPQDGRRVYIELSDDAADRCEAYLRAAQRVAPVAI